MLSNTDVHDTAISDSQRLSKYVYPEFAGFDGERLLKWVLRKILPSALYRTWEIFADHQAAGNDCFLSLARVAEVSGRSERTIRLDVHELVARKLLVLRPERKLLRQADGSFRLCAVVCKDFAGLYALAHEYLAWTASPSYVAPERELMDLVRADEALVAKLRRFNNYRRLLLNQAPGPRAKPRDEHRWFSEYEAQEAPAETNCTIRKEHLQEDRQDNLQEVSEERTGTNQYTDSSERDSFESKAPLREEDSGYTKEPRETTSPEETNPLPVPEETRAAARAFVERARARGAAAKEPPASLPKLVAAFVAEVAPIFGDQNPKGSLTRARRCVEAARLSERELLACLVKAYLVATETRHVRPKYRRAGGDNKMPLFCTMLERFIADAAVGRLDYDDDHLVADIASDDRLVLFVVEQHLEATLAGEENGKAPAGDEAVQVELVAEEPAVEPAQPGESPEPGHDPAVEPAPVPSRPHYCIEVEDPGLGWRTYEGAEWWGRRLCEHLGEAAYDFACLPTAHGRYGLVLFECGRSPQKGWVFLTVGEVKQYL